MYYNYIDKSSNKNAIIINTIKDANEDIYCGRKINKLLINLGYSTIVYPLLLEGINNKQKKLCEFFITNTKETIISDNTNTNSKKTIIVITPTCTNQIKKLVDFLEIIYELYNLKTNKIFIFTDTMYKQNFDIHLLAKETKKNISYNSLGFHKDQLGYIPLETTEINSLNNNYNLIIKLLCDSLNLDISIKDKFFIGYLNSENYIMPILIFLHNSLLEYRSRVSVFLENILNYIFFCEHKINDYELQSIIKECTDPNSIYHIKAATINFYFYRSNFELLVSYKTSFKSIKAVNIFFTNKILPEKIFNCFIKLSEYGMMSGNNLLINYMSIKQELPYYCFNEKEALFIHELLYEAENSGLYKLHNYYKCKFIGENYFGFSQNKILENEICDKTDFEIYKQDYRQEESMQAENELKYIHIIKYKFESEIINRHANIKIENILP